MKSDWQRRVLWQIFYKLEGALTQEIKQEAMRKTGLPWNKIYKWIYDNDPLLRRKPLSFERREGERLFDYSRTKPLFKIKRTCLRGRKCQHQRK